jgi:hypothetical protein
MEEAREGASLFAILSGIIRFGMSACHFFIHPSSNALKHLLVSF